MLDTVIDGIFVLITSCAVAFLVATYLRHKDRELTRTMQRLNDENYAANRQFLVDAAARANATMDVGKHREEHLRRAAEQP